MNEVMPEAYHNGEKFRFYAMLFFFGVIMIFELFQTVLIFVSVNVIFSFIRMARFTQQQSD